MVRKHYAKFALFALVVLMLLLSITPLAAQGATEAPAPTPAPLIPITGDVPVENEPPLVDVNAAFNIIITTLMTVVTSGAVGAAFSPAVTAIVGVLKYLPFLRNFQSKTILLLVNTVVWLGAAAAVQWGFQTQFSSLMSLIAVALPAATLFISTLIGAPLVHEWASEKGLPILGDKKTPPVTAEWTPASTGVSAATLLETEQVVRAIVDDELQRRGAVG